MGLRAIRSDGRDDGLARGDTSARRLLGPVDEGSRQGSIGSATHSLAQKRGGTCVDHQTFQNLLDRPSQILRKIEEHCQSLVQAYVRQLSLDYQMAYDASRRESLMRDMKRMHTELAVDFSDFSDYGAFFSCAEAQMSEACVPVAYESSTPNCDLTNSDRVSALL